MNYYKSIAMFIILGYTFTIKISYRNYYVERFCKTSHLLDGY